MGEEESASGGEKETTFYLPLSGSVSLTPPSQLRKITTMLPDAMGQIPQDGNFGENVAYFF